VQSGNLELNNVGLYRGTRLEVNHNPLIYPALVLFEPIDCIDWIMFVKYCH
jgi:hypothetical protein